MVGKRKDRQTDAFEIRYHRATLIDVLINQRPGVTSTRRSRQRRLTYRGARGCPKAQSRDNFSTGSKLTGRAILREPLLPLPPGNKQPSAALLSRAHAARHVACDVRSWNGELVDFQFASDRHHFVSTFFPPPPFVSLNELVFRELNILVEEFISTVLFDLLRRHAPFIVCLCEWK